MATDLKKPLCGLLTGQENSGQIVHYSDHHLNNRLKYLNIRLKYLNNRLLDYRTTFDHWNTTLVWYSDPTVLVYS